MVGQPIRAHFTMGRQEGAHARARLELLKPGAWTQGACQRHSSAKPTRHQRARRHLQTRASRSRRRTNPHPPAACETPIRPATRRTPQQRPPPPPRPACQGAQLGPGSGSHRQRVQGGGGVRSRRPMLRTSRHTRGPAVVQKHRWILKVKLPKHFALQHPEVGGQQVAMPARGICVKRAHAIWSSGSRGPFPAPQPPNHWCRRRCHRGPPRGIGG